MARPTVTSVNSIGRLSSELSMVISTDARPMALRLPAPAKMTSDIEPPRRSLADRVPIDQVSASTMLDLPDPLGPTITVMPGSKSSRVESAKDLKPRRARDLRYTVE